MPRRGCSVVISRRGLSSQLMQNPEQKTAAVLSDC
jgi:hypothetical protein